MVLSFCAEVLNSKSSRSMQYQCFLLRAALCLGDMQMSRGALLGVAGIQPNGLELPSWRGTRMPDSAWGQR